MAPDKLRAPILVAALAALVVAGGVAGTSIA
jgi:hypothetical protein